MSRSNYPQSLLCDSQLSPDETQVYSGTVRVDVTAPALQGCPADDVDRNQVGDMVDIGLVVGHWGLTSADPGWTRCTMWSPTASSTWPM